MPARITELRVPMCHHRKQGATQPVPKQLGPAFCLVSQKRCNAELARGSGARPLRGVSGTDLKAAHKEDASLCQPILGYLWVRNSPAPVVSVGFAVPFLSYFSFFSDRVSGLLGRP